VATRAVSGVRTEKDTEESDAEHHAWLGCIMVLSTNKSFYGCIGFDGCPGSQSHSNTAVPMTSFVLIATLSHRREASRTALIIGLVEILFPHMYKSHRPPALSDLKLCNRVPPPLAAHIP
jgi:hypothetical protein